LRCRIRRLPPPAPAPPKPSMVVPWEPLPPTAKDRFNAALAALEQKIKARPDSRDWCYRCWFDKLRNGADDHVIEWHRICPAQTGAIGAAYAVGACNVADGSPVDQAALEHAIHATSDVEKPNAGLSSSRSCDRTLSLRTSQPPKRSTWRISAQIGQQQKNPGSVYSCP
jgi:hypothetical protein